MGCLVANLVVCYFVVLIMLDFVVFELLWAAGWCGGFWRLAGFADLSWGWYNITECRSGVWDGFWCFGVWVVVPGGWFWCLGGALGWFPCGVLLCIAFRWVVLRLVVGVRKLQFWFDWCVGFVGVLV